MTNLQVVTTPTFDWLAEHALACNSRMIVDSKLHAKIHTQKSLHSRERRPSD